MQSFLANRTRYPTNLHIHRAIFASRGTAVRAVGAFVDRCLDFCQSEERYCRTAVVKAADLAELAGMYTFFLVRVFFVRASNPLSLFLEISQCSMKTVNNKNKNRSSHYNRILGRNPPGRLQFDHYASAVITKSVINKMLPFLEWLRAEDHAKQPSKQPSKQPLSNSNTRSSRARLGPER
jgi:hypothetical protein